MSREPSGASFTGSAKAAEQPFAKLDSAPVSVIGGGAWGIALATAAANAGSDVLLYSRRAPEVQLHERIKLTKTLTDVGRHAHLLVLTVPSEFVRPVARALGDVLDGRHAIVHGVRGLVAQDGNGDLATISSVLRQETPVRRLGALGGPVLTEELAAGAPSVMVVGSRYPEVIKVVKGALATPSLRLYSTDDLIGLEWASALTGILAVAVGFARGVGLGAGILSAFVTRGVHEAARIGAAAGAEERTFLGLGGFGDLLAAIAEESRPEIRLGEAVARGVAVEQAIADVGQRIEAIELAPRVAAFATRHRVMAPIFTSVAHGIFARRPAAELVAELMMGPITSPA
ncbi:MAG: NAD(P)-binding domain-containing protein [Polyangiales bacterium]